VTGTYGYFDRGEGLVLVKRVGHSQGHFYDTGELVYLRGAKLQPVPRGFLQRRRAPTIIWKPRANPHVVAEYQVEMVRLEGPAPAGTSWGTSILVGLGLGAVVGGLVLAHR
jgi:hypothetical protein